MKGTSRISLLILCFCLSGIVSHAQQVGIKTNTLYWTATTPNLGLEWRLAPRYTLSATFGYNAFNFPSSAGAKGAASNPKIHHWLIMPEGKYWFCRSFERGYLGVHALYGRYNAGGLKLLSFLSESRYKGWAAGGGISYGYQWAIGKRWGLEGSLGIGYLYFQYDKYNCGSCGKKLGSFHRHYFGPTKAALSIIYYVH